MSEKHLGGLQIGKPGRGRWLAGAAGVGAIGTIAGASVAHSMLNRRAVVNDPFAHEDFESLDGDRSYLVTTPDGVHLTVREVGPTDAPLTVVFAHGFCLRMGAFHFQRMRLSEEWDSQVRMIFYDQRGHGRSGEAPPETYTITQLGKDLETVLQVIAPRGPIVLVGHSMGGMTVLSHARQFPEHYGSRDHRRGTDLLGGRRCRQVAAGRDSEQPCAGGCSAGRAVGTQAGSARTHRRAFGDRAGPAGGIVYR